MEEREKKEVVHLMVDIETLGKEPGCVVLSFSVKKFDPFGVKYTDVITEAVVDVFSSLMMGLKVDEDTVNWWKGQKDALLSMNAAQMNEKTDARDAAFQLYDVLSYIQEHYDVKLCTPHTASEDVDKQIKEVKVCFEFMGKH